MAADSPLAHGRFLTWRETPLGDGWDLAPDAVVWIDVALFDALWARTDQYVSPGGVRGAQDNRYARVAAFIATQAPINMVMIGIDE